MLTSLELPDATLIVASVEDPPAFAAVFDRHWTGIHRYCVSRAPSVGEDLAAETFRVAFDRRAKYDDRYADARPWLYGIATNLASRRWRGERRRLRAYGRSGAERWVALDDDDVVARVDGSALRARLARALTEMRPRERDALLLYALADLSYEEIALALEIPTGTVGTWLHRAREIARRELTAETAPTAVSGGGSSG